ncbi:hypothetical protein [Falsiroseomonas sp. CW058]|uniref:hypothetical protein n=1 Tax=Falsiroseomonas sp. CW058 TaxID=3388664 RepID=UPI003D314198
MRLRPALTRLLAALLLLQWGTAFAHCLRLSAPAELLHAELCTPEGIRTVALGADGQPAEVPDPAVLPAPLCPACLGPAALVLPPPEAALAPPLQLAQAADPPPAPAPAPRPLPSPSCQPRAPPTS